MPRSTAVGSTTKTTATPNATLRRQKRRSTRDNHDINTESKPSLGRKKGLLSGLEDHPMKDANRPSASSSTDIEKQSTHETLGRKSLATTATLARVHQEGVGAVVPETRTNKRQSEQQGGGDVVVAGGTRAKASSLPGGGGSSRTGTGAAGRPSASRAGNQNNPAEGELRTNSSDDELHGLAEVFQAAVSQAADARFFEHFKRQTAKALRETNELRVKLARTEAAVDGGKQQRDIAEAELQEKLDHSHEEIQRLEAESEHRREQHTKSVEEGNTLREELKRSQEALSFLSAWDEEKIELEARVASLEPKLAEAIKSGDLRVEEVRRSFDIALAEEGQKAAARMSRDIERARAELERGLSEEFRARRRENDVLRREREHQDYEIVRITKDVANIEAELRTCRAELNDERRMHLMAIRKTKRAEAVIAELHRHLTAEPSSSTLIPRATATSSSRGNNPSPRISNLDRRQHQEQEQHGPPTDDSQPSPRYRAVRPEAAAETKSRPPRGRQGGRLGAKTSSSVGSSSVSFAEQRGPDWEEEGKGITGISTSSVDPAGRGGEMGGRGGGQDRGGRDGYQENGDGILLEYMKLSSGSVKVRIVDDNDNDHEGERLDDGSGTMATAVSNLSVPARSPDNRALDRDSGGGGEGGDQGQGAGVSSRMATGGGVANGDSFNETAAGGCGRKRRKCGNAVFEDESGTTRDEDHSDVASVRSTTTEATEEGREVRPGKGPGRTKTGGEEGGEGEGEGEEREAEIPELLLLPSCRSEVSSSTDVWAALDSYVRRRSEVERAKRHVRAIEAMRKHLTKVSDPTRHCTGNNGGGRERSRNISNSDEAVMWKACGGRCARRWNMDESGRIKMATRCSSLLPVPRENREEGSWVEKGDPTTTITPRRHQRSRRDRRTGIAFRNHARRDVRSGGQTTTGTPTTTAQCPVYRRSRLLPASWEPGKQEKARCIV